MKANLESTMETILDKIVARKKEEVFLGKKNIPEAELLKRLGNVPQPCSFYDALANAKGIGVIAEIKKASPSAGVLRESFCPASISK